MNTEQLQKFYLGKKVLITGNTGFKGSWLSIVLNMWGAKVFGYSLEPPTKPSLFLLAGLNESTKTVIADIRDFTALKTCITEIKPDIIIHMAAQPLVRASYVNPIETYEINVMGSVNLLQAIREVGGVKAVVNVTTDKCYENREWHWGYRENEPMGGYDPYSNSKGCSELVTSSFRSSFFNSNDYEKHGVALASARAGNVIGGGDWAEDRLIPDFFRAIEKGASIQIRSPYAIRPWQHVLEPLTGYLVLAKYLYENKGKFAEGWNFGPNDEDAKNVEWITKKICNLWGNGASYTIDKNPQPHEANYLKLDCSKAKIELKWSPIWDIETALNKIVNWNKQLANGKKALAICEEQITEYYQDINIKTII